MFRWLSLLFVCTLLLGPTPTGPVYRIYPLKFWHLEHDKTWWLTSPNGEHEFLNSVTTIIPTQESRNSDGYRARAFTGDLDAWAKAEAQRVLSVGFKASGAWSSPAIAPYMPYAKDLNLSKHVSLSVADQSWQLEIEKSIVEQVVPLRDDTNLIGYYLDNELPWGRDAKLCANASKYFNTTSQLIRKYDPNHLILGVRFNHLPPREVLDASKGCVDVHSVNVYSGTYTFAMNEFAEIHAVTGCPIIISEFCVWAKKNASGNRNTHAWWAGLENQRERAMTYERMATGAAMCSYVVGIDWFQWCDEPRSGRADGEDINCGIVNTQDEEYPEMVQATRRIAACVNHIHAGGNERPRSGVWK